MFWYLRFRRKIFSAWFDAPQFAPPQSAIDRLQIPIVGVVELVNSLPNRLGVADHDRVGLLPRLFGNQGDVDSRPHYHRHAAGREIAHARSSSRLASAREGLDADGDEVRRLIERDLFHAIIIETAPSISGGVIRGQEAAIDNGSICQART